MSKIIKTQKYLVIKCDFCDRDSDQTAHRSIKQCAICGKDICNNHNDVDVCEDGILCPICTEHYEIEEEDGGVGIRNKHTNQLVDAKYL